ncbi:MAG TPA: hypothetical protein VHR66_30770 [Gemmataceae bacterium]|jgi:hypothetical protein|nr:hypothetical protein [Gemmataceae bacterium]
MIISHQHRLIFVKTLKSAGTSIEVFLSQHCGPNDVVTPILPHVEPHRPRNHEGYFNHMPAAAIRNRVGPAIWRSYFKICVERNPWDKTLSYYHMMNARAGGTLSLDSFLRSQDLPVNVPKYTEPNDPKTIIVDRVLHYERLTEDLREVFARIGIPFDGSLGVNAKSEYRTDRRPYREIYTDEQARLVAAAFGEEIALHGYAY